MVTNRLFIPAICLVLFASPGNAQTAQTGKTQYQALCVGCHGEDGAGGGHGPGFLDVQRPIGTSREAVRDLILKGIPSKGMPAYKISSEQADAIAAYVMTLKQPSRGGAVAGTPAPGDAGAGEHFFAGKGNCTGCHMIRGRGGVRIFSAVIGARLCFLPAPWRFLRPRFPMPPAISAISAACSCPRP